MAKEHYPCQAADVINNITRSKPFLCVCVWGGRGGDLNVQRQMSLDLPDYCVKPRKFLSTLWVLNLANLPG